MFYKYTLWRSKIQLKISNSPLIIALLRLVTFILLKYIFLNLFCSCRTRMDHVSNQSALFLSRTPRGKWLWLIQEMFWYMTSTKLTCLTQMVRNNVTSCNFYQTLKQFFKGMYVCYDTVSIANILKLSGILLIPTLLISYWNVSRINCWCTFYTDGRSYAVAVLG